MAALTFMRRKFVLEYITDHNGAAALGRAGSKASERNRATHAGQLLRLPEVIAEIAKQEAALLIRLERTADDISRKRWEIIDNPNSVPNDVLTALRDESKRYAEFTEKHELKAQVENVERRYVGIDVSLV